MKTTILFLLLLGVLIYVHELGHFLTARLLGIRVLRFSMGFGPVLKRWGKGETEYAISAIPLGGYVKLHGEETSALEGGEEAPEVDEKRSFAHRPVLHRAAVIVAGPTMNILLALLLFSGIALRGEQIGLPVIGTVSEEMPAAAAGLLPGDRIAAVGGVETPTWEAMSREVRASGGRETALTVVRGGETLMVKIAAVDRSAGEGGETVYIIGIQGPGAFDTKPTPLWRAPIEGARLTLSVVAITGDAIWKLFTGRGSREDLMGPIGIAVETGQAAERGLAYFLSLMAVLSVNLGVLNLLPIPVLDGGHLLFLALEGVRRKPVSMRVREVAFQIGFFFLVSLMAYVILNDIFRIVSG